MKYIILWVIGYFIFRSIRKYIAGTTGRKQRNEPVQNTKDANFQQKYKGKIEDADFEEFD